MEYNNIRYVKPMYRLEPQMFHELFFIKQGKIKTNDFSCLQFSVRLKNVTKI